MQAWVTLDGCHRKGLQRKIAGQPATRGVLHDLPAARQLLPHSKLATFVTLSVADNQLAGVNSVFHRQRGMAQTGLGLAEYSSL